MLAERIKQWEEQLKQQAMQQGLEQGLEAGLEKGLEKGLVIGEQKLLIRQITRRFGPLPDEIRQRIEQANIDQIEEWADRILDARSLADIFAGRA